MKLFNQSGIQYAILHQIQNHQTRRLLLDVGGTATTAIHTWLLCSPPYYRAPTSVPNLFQYCPVYSYRVNAFGCFDLAFIGHIFDTHILSR